MDSVLPALLAVTILLLASLMIGRSSFSSFQTLGDAWLDAEEHSIERVRSDITITSVSPSGSDVDVTVRNDGATPIVDFSRMDVVVQYQDTGGTQTKYIPFTTESAPQPDDTWRPLLLTDDVIDPGVLNTDESMTIRIVLDPAPASGSHWVQVTTELGISASTFFTV